jgi:hypothetical protein
VKNLATAFQIEARTRRFAAWAANLSEERTKKLLVALYRTMLVREKRHVARIGQAWGIKK